MKKIRVVFIAALLCITGLTGSVFATGYPVLDISNLLENIEAVYQYYQQIQNTIEQVQNTYKQIEQTAQQMKSMNFDDLKGMGKNFEGMRDNPFEVITGVRNSAQDITAAVNRNMNKVNDFKNALNAKSIKFGNQSVSMADLCGAGEPGNNVLGFAKNAWEWSTDTEDGPFADSIKAWTGELTYEQRERIMWEYGMSPENYASIEYGNYQLNKVVSDFNVLCASEKEELEEIEAEHSAILKMCYEAEEGSMYAQAQVTNSALASIDKNLGALGTTFTKVGSMIGSIFTSQKRDEAVKRQEENRKKQAMRNEEGSSLLSNDND